MLLMLVTGCWEILNPKGLGFTISLDATSQLEYP